MARSCTRNSLPPRVRLDHTLSRVSLVSPLRSTEENSRSLDLKVYAIGDNYAYAEMRKAPAIDGVVERTPEGKEVRIIATLSEDEKRIARQVVRCFRQRICGFDILRTMDGRSLVCDVNGLSFVKSNPTYFADCGERLHAMFLNYMHERYVNEKPFRHERTLAMVRSNLWREHSRNPINLLNLQSLRWQEGSRLLAVSSVIRHADRTPKQKLKQGTSQPELLEFFRKYAGSLEGEVRLRRGQIAEFVAVCREMLANKHAQVPSNMPRVLTRSGQFVKQPSITRLSSGEPLTEEELEEFRRIGQIVHILENNATGTKFQMRSQADTTYPLLLICKWGGVLTSAGCRQAELLGLRFRNFIETNAPAGTAPLFLQHAQMYANTEARVTQVQATDLRS